MYVYKRQDVYLWQIAIISSIDRFYKGKYYLGCVVSKDIDTYQSTDNPHALIRPISSPDKHIKYHNYRNKHGYSWEHS